jgi:hypothetical protein
LTPNEEAPVSESATSERARRDAAEAAVFGHYGRACTCCGATENLTIDHVNGGGKAHRRRLGVNGGRAFWAWLIAQGFPDGYQTMCTPCNQSKGAGAACRLWHGDPGFRRCLGPCGLVKALGEFKPHTRSRGGRSERCRDCRNAADRARYAAAHS